MLHPARWVRTTSPLPAGNLEDRAAQRRSTSPAAAGTAHPRMGSIYPQGPGANIATGQGGSRQSLREGPSLCCSESSHFKSRSPSAAIRPPQGHGTSEGHRILPQPRRRERADQIEASESSAGGNRWYRGGFRAGLPRRAYCRGSGSIIDLRILSSLFIAGSEYRQGISASIHIKSRVLLQPVYQFDHTYRPAIHSERIL
ncbi:uncharacterized protein BJX67DRAFT_188709 [Aspergillus lucknowensis]|uniref:Uncharacterized protein n=1 Tax=Aspergillus lucknowensis TaxID=176173 RepID=A0ABR4LKS8_9EURO